MTFKKHFSELIIKNAESIKSEKPNQIFVLQGQTNLLDIELCENFISDKETFHIHSDELIFNKDWFSKIFLTLQQPKDYHLLSFAQFSYLINYIDPSFFADRIIIFKDNLRNIFPINKAEYIETDGKDNIELRPARLPIYQADQIIVNEKYYFSLKSPIQNFRYIDIYSNLKDLKYSNDSTLESIDVTSEPYSLDIFINNCIEEDCFSKKALVKIHSKQHLNPVTLDALKKLNSLLSKFEGTLYIFEEAPLPSDYRVDEKTEKMLIKFWGESAAFRNIMVYEDPNIGNAITELSQGFIVETIINEYEISRLNKSCRDLFLTAPTGAGKSLLFQLPAFYISEKGDVTIVVSPLIALMKDQVSAIMQDRNFDKAAYINSELSLIDRERIIEKCKNGDIDILYMSPELLLSYDVTHFIGFRRLGLLVIDEAHLITTWGRDFRVDYWFLGNHIRKMRKYHNLEFPMVAVTATAIFGGSNDMVFDSIDSLVMHNPHIFIGQVRRNDIKFIIDNYEHFNVNYESNKISQTVEFIKKINELDLKTLVYTPYTRHIKEILKKLNADFNYANIATGYYGKLNSQSKEFAYRQFKNGQTKIMISTKAFGMGIDISDIQVVYHHAPSGLLPDYVQEIGRVARQPDIKGFAILNYSSQDQWYTKALHGMSALKQYQVREVIKKIHKAYLKNNNNRNLLLSVDDFGHIFQNSLDIDQKVLTALMMIEKDYLAKNRFNVIIARPKKLFVKVYARVSDQGLNILINKYSNTFKILIRLGNGNNIIEIDLDKLWNDHFANISFPILKKDFYTGQLFNNDKIELFPQLKLSFERLDTFNNVLNIVQNTLNYVKNIFARNSKYFNEGDFRKDLNQIINDDVKSEKLSKFILSTYSKGFNLSDKDEPNAFLQQKKNKNGIGYRVFNNQYLSNFSAILTRLTNLFENTEKSIVEKYITKSETNQINYVRLGYFLEILELGTFEIKGGENPMIFIRINDPKRIERDSYDKSYNNSLLAKTLDRHSLSNQIFDHFFLRTFNNSERWDFIEDFFLGTDVDVLLEKHKGGEINRTNIIETLKNQGTSVPVIQSKKDLDKNSNINIFHPTPDNYYSLKDLLTITYSDKLMTLKVSEWLSTDTVSFDMSRRKIPFKVTKEVYGLLTAKLKALHPKYFNDIMGLSTLIEFKGYNGPVVASLPYTAKPLEFYEWWCANEDCVNMTFKEKILLFDKVYSTNPKKLKEGHKKLINKH